ncbi:MAG: hypothetical protein HEP71_13430 [Roseivirga sp.]|nr:hypothetical protein [Roseivirga sp.]
MNYIKKVRDQLQQLFESGSLRKTRQETFLSPDARYRILASYHAPKEEKLNWKITQVEVFEVEHEARLFHFICNDDSFFHAWLSVKNTDYLICS